VENPRVENPRGEKRQVESPEKTNTLLVLRGNLYALSRANKILSITKEMELAVQDWAIKIATSFNNKNY